jgi:hypothetical protein
VAASKTEDAFGVVQAAGSIEGSLVSLLDCLAALDEYLAASFTGRFEGHHARRPTPFALQTGTLLYSASVAHFRGF